MLITSHRLVLASVALIAACQVNPSVDRQHKVNVEISGVVKTPGVYRVNREGTFEELLREAGGVQTRVDGRTPKHVHGVQVLRKLADGSSLFYLWNRMTDKRQGRWHFLNDKDMVIFHPGSEPSE